MIGAVFVILALFPKLPAALLTIPNPAMGAYLLTATGLLFDGGVRTVIQDRLAYLTEEAEGLEEGEISLRLLRQYASSVHHQKYYGLDIVTVQVKGSR